jgi:hypothetical protein
MPQKREQVRLTLDLVDHDETAQILERKLRLLEPREVSWATSKCQSPTMRFQGNCEAAERA